MKTYIFYIAHAHGCFMNASERYLARSMFSSEDVAISQLHISAKEFLRSHAGCMQFCKPQQDIEARYKDEYNALWKKHEEDIDAIRSKYWELLQAANDKAPGVYGFENPEVTKLISERANEYRKIDDAYEAARKVVDDKCDAEKKQWRIYNAKDVDAFIKKCQAYNKEHKIDGLTFYCTVDRKKDDSGFPFVDMGYSKCIIE